MMEASKPSLPHTNMQTCHPCLQYTNQQAGRLTMTLHCCPSWASSSGEGPCSCSLCTMSRIFSTSSAYTASTCCACICAGWDGTWARSRALRGGNGLGKASWLGCCSGTVTDCSCVACSQQARLATLLLHCQLIELILDADSTKLLRSKYVAINHLITLNGWLPCDLTAVMSV